MVYLLLYDRRDMSDAIAFQKEKVKYLRHGLNMIFESMPEITIPEKDMELYYT